MPQSVGVALFWPLHLWSNNHCEIQQLICYFNGQTIILTPPWTSIAAKKWGDMQAVSDLKSGKCMSPDNISFQTKTNRRQWKGKWGW